MLVVMGVPACTFAVLQAVSLFMFTSSPEPSLSKTNLITVVVVVALHIFPVSPLTAVNSAVCQLVWVIAEGGLSRRLVRSRGPLTTKFDVFKLRSTRLLR